MQKSNIPAQARKEITRARKQRKQVREMKRNQYAAVCG